jgi:hypothetical protein
VTVIKLSSRSAARGDLHLARLFWRSERAVCPSHRVSFQRVDDVAPNTLKFFAVLTVLHHSDQAFPTLRATRPFHGSLQSNGYLPKKQLRSKKRRPPFILDQGVALGYDCDGRREPSRTAAPDARCSSSAGYSENGLLDLGHGDIFHQVMDRGPRRDQSGRACRQVGAVARRAP